jgi:hypothetical protein
VRRKSSGPGPELAAHKKPGPSPKQSPIDTVSHEDRRRMDSMHIKKGYKELLAAANAEIETLPVEAAIELVGNPKCYSLICATRERWNAKAGCRAPSPVRAGCWNSGSTPRARTPSQCSRNLSASSSFALAAGDPR